MLSRHPFDRCQSSSEERASLERDRAAWQQHLWSCRACRAELEARQRLESAAKGIETPRLSPEFDARLFARLQREAPARRLPSAARRWLAAYWVATAALSVYITLRTEALTLERGLDTLSALALIWGVVQAIPRRVVRRAAALLDG